MTGETDCSKAYVARRADKKGGTVLDNFNIKGLEYLEDNKFMRKSAELLK